jgi:hypothetical protein
MSCIENYYSFFDKKDKQKAAAANLDSHRTQLAGKRNRSWSSAATNSYNLRPGFPYPFPFLYFQMQFHSIPLLRA